MSCAKTAEPIQMQFRMLSEVGPGNMYYMGMQNADAPMERGTFQVGMVMGKMRTCGVQV